MTTQREKIIARVFFTTVTAITLVYIIGYIQLVPYTGFRFNASTGKVIILFDKTQPLGLRPGDQIQKIGALSFSDYENSLTATFWDGVSPGEVVPIDIIRDGEAQTVQWRFTGYNTPEFNDRFYSPWLISMVFLFFGIITYNSVRPKNVSWAIIVPTSFSTAVIVAAWIGAYQSHIFYAAHLTRLAVWVIIPLLIHLHWLFPTPLSRLPNWVDNYLIPGIYLISIPLLVIDLRNPSLYIYRIGIMVSFFISICLLIVRMIVQKQYRRQVRLILVFIIVASFPLLSYITVYFLKVPFGIHTSYWASITFPLFSVGYVILIWQRQVSDTRFRSNRILALSICLAGLFPLTIVLVNLLSSSQNTLSTPTASFLIIVFAIVSVISFNQFQKFVEHFFLRMPVPIPDLIGYYSKNLATTDTPTGIASSMEKIVLPTLLVRQSALLEFQSQSMANVLDYYGVEPFQIPQSDVLQNLVRKDTPILSLEYTQQLPPEFQWIRVVIPLIFNRELIGVWLLGTRDPDDLYPPDILSMLESVAQQTTFAIINHQKTTRLRALYQANMHRNERERASLSRDLHDVTLNQIALLQREYTDPKLVDSLNLITASLRKVIQGLRPEMISFGLINALEDMADSLNERNPATPITVNLEGIPFPLKGLEEEELHIFRIVQQACENAIQHAGASAITVEGSVSEKNIYIIVSDDGRGIESASNLDLTALIHHQNFGLASMYERADLINAVIKINSHPNEGTQIHVTWPASTLE